MSKIIFKKPKFRKKLFISKEPYFLEKNKDEGVADLKRLARRSKHEGAWIFSPEISIWFNITRDYSDTSFKSREVEFSVSQYPIDLRQLGRDLIHYHIHPIRAYSIMEDFLREDYGNKASLFQDLIEESPYERVAINFLNQTFHLPSSQDLVAYSELKMSNRDVSLNAEIIAPKGHSVIEITNPGNGQTYESWYKDAKYAIAKYKFKEKKLMSDIQRYLKWLKGMVFDRYDHEVSPPTLEGLISSASGVMNITPFQDDA